MGRPFWREDGSVIYSYKCHWALPARSLAGPSRAELETIPFLTLSFETGCYFVASYDSQGYGGSILTRFHTTLQYSILETCFIYSATFPDSSRVIFCFEPLRKTQPQSLYSFAVVSSKDPTEQVSVFSLKEAEGSSDRSAVSSGCLGFLMTEEVLKPSDFKR
jgi:hypothetical protein